MYISNIRLQNWKNFSDVSVVLENRSFLVGPNASGKSNFLDAIKFLRDISYPGGGLDNALTRRGGIKKVRSLSARGMSDVIITVILSDELDQKPIWEYTLGITQEHSGSRRTLISKEIVQHLGNTIINRPDPSDKKDILRLTQTHLEQINANESFREINVFFASVKYVHLVPQLIRQPELFFNSTVKMDEDSYGFHFIENIAKTPQGILRSRLRKIENALQVAVPQLKDLREVRDANGVPHLEALYEHWRPNAGRQQESQFSDGTIRLIGLLWSILDSNSVLLLEEPELSLHTAIVRQIPSLIYRINQSKKKRIQTLISTHSPDLLSDVSISGKEIVLFKPGLEGTTVQTASQIDEIRVLLEGGLSPQEVIIPRSTPENIEKLTQLK